jgi:hypothetical protein
MKLENELKPMKKYLCFLMFMWFPMKKRIKETSIVGKDDRKCVFFLLNLMDEFILI